MTVTVVYISVLCTWYDSKFLLEISHCLNFFIIIIYFIFRLLDYGFLEKKVGYILLGHCGEPRGQWNVKPHTNCIVMRDDQKNSRGFVKLNDRYE